MATERKQEYETKVNTNSKKDERTEMETKYQGLEIIRTDRIYLEPLSLKHLEDFHELWTSEEAVRWSTKIVMKNIEESKQFMEKILPNEQNPDIDKFAILLKDTPTTRALNLPTLKNSRGEPKCIGITGTNRWSPQGMEAGYCLSAAFWGRGFATEGFGLFLKGFWGLKERKSIPHLVAKTSPENLASKRVLEKCGGREGGIIKMKSMWKKEGMKEGEGDDEDEGYEVLCWYFDRPGEESEG